MSSIAAFIMIFVVLRRRRTGITIAAPFAVMVLGAVRGVLLTVMMVMLVGTFKSLAGVPEDQKQRVLEAGVSEATAWGSFLSWADLVLLVAAFYWDRQLRDRQRRSQPGLTPAPSGGLCAAHASASAVFICARCGAFMCQECGANLQGRCPACVGREVEDPPLGFPAGRV